MRPLNCLRYLVFFGDIMGGGSLGVRLGAPIAARSARTLVAVAIPARTFSGRPGFPGQPFVLRHRVVLEHFAFEDPDLHADDAIGGLGFSESVVEVRAQRVQWHAALAIAFHARDFGPAEAAGDADPDALGAEAHGALHRTFHGAAKR